MTTSPTIFLSYSHDTSVHKEWVRRLAEDLTKNGVETLLDQWHLKVGDDIGAFMEQSVRKAKYVVLVCTEIFAKKTNSREGGVGYEQTVIVGELLTNRALGSRFLPVLRRGEPSEALPLFLQSRLFIDFRDNDGYQQALEQLLRRIFEAPIFSPPPLGKIPQFAIKEHTMGGSTEANLPSATTTFGAARGWILVAGTGVGKLEDKLEKTCIALGKALAQSRYGIVTGGWAGVDELTSRSFARELEYIGTPLEDRLVQVIVNDAIPAFSAGSLIFVPAGDEEWTEAVKRAEAIILIGGLGGTWTTGRYGLEFGRAVFPLADTGGDAAKFYIHMQHNWRPEFVPGIDKQKFGMTAREAPQVVTPLIELLDEWKNKQAVITRFNGPS